MSERAAPADAAEMSLELWRNQVLGEDGELALGTSRFKSVDHEEQVDGQTGEVGRESWGQAGRFSGGAPAHPPPRGRGSGGGGGGTTGGSGAAPAERAGGGGAGVL